MSSIDTFTEFHTGHQKLGFTLEKKNVSKFEVIKNVNNKKKRSTKVWPHCVLRLILEPSLSIRSYSEPYTLFDE